MHVPSDVVRGVGRRGGRLGLGQGLVQGLPQGGLGAQPAVLLGHGDDEDQAQRQQPVEEVVGRVGAPLGEQPAVGQRDEQGEGLCGQDKALEVAL